MTDACSTRKRRAVVTGIGPVTPLGVGHRELWSAALAGRSATTALRRLPGGVPIEAFGSRVVAEIPPAALERAGARASADRRLTLAHLALDLAVWDAGLESTAFRDASIVFGNAVGSPILVEEFVRRRDGSVPAEPLGGAEELLGALSFHTPARSLAEALGCRGRVLTVSTGCTAGSDAIGIAADLVRSGGSDLVISGSAEAPLTAVVLAAFDRIGALSRRNHDPAGASRPFDRERDGFVLAEGAAILVLEELGRARARGAHVYGEVSGYASVSNAYHMTNLPADGEELARCMRLALEDAGVRPEEVDMVNAHGSSTPQNDLCETNAVKAVLGRQAHRVPVNSLKSMIGHALGASNAIEVAACALGLEQGRVFPTANLQEPGEGCDLDYVPGTSRRAQMRHLLKLSSGFSGIHSVLVMTAPGVLS